MVCAEAGFVCTINRLIPHNVTLHAGYGEIRLATCALFLDEGVFTGDGTQAMDRALAMRPKPWWTVSRSACVLAAISPRSACWL